MKFENVKAGTRVQLKKDFPFVPSLKKGMTGIIIEENNYCPYISWDNFTIGHSGKHFNQTRIDLGLPENSVCFTNIEYLKRIKE